VLLLTALAFYTRLVGLDKPAFVVWDESYFGRFAAYYIRNRYAVFSPPSSFLVP
jgi:dolichyl-phosphate-mannose--protein O-mannosyl transferase